MIASGAYHIDGRDLNGAGDSYVTAASRRTLTSSISFTGAGFAIPNTVTSNSGSRFGPNFQFRDAANAVPEPESWAMLIAGFGLVNAIERRCLIAIFA